MCATNKCRDRAKQNTLTQRNNGCSYQLGLGQKKPLLVCGDHIRCPSELTLCLTEEKKKMEEKRTWKTGNLSNLGTFPDFKIH